MDKTTLISIACDLRGTSITKEPPYDPITICSGLGIVCAQIPLPKDVRSVIYKDKFKDPVILIDTDYTINRKRV